MRDTSNNVQTKRDWFSDGLRCDEKYENALEPKFRNKRIENSLEIIWNVKGKITDNRSNIYYNEKSIMNDNSMKNRTKKKMVPLKYKSENNKAKWQ